jgi:hypothetical protein
MLKPANLVARGSGKISIDSPNIFKVEARP